MLNSLFESFDEIKAVLKRALPQKRHTDENLYNFESDVLIYVDDQGADAAYSEGAEIVAKSLLSPESLDALLKNGFAVEGVNICAFGRYLMLKFIEASVLIEAADRKEQHILCALRQMTNQRGSVVENEYDRLTEQ